MKSFTRKTALAVGIVLAAMFTLVPTAAMAEDASELVPGTAVLLNQSSSGTGGGGNGGNAKVASSATNIFSPAVFVDYKRFGGEPTVIVDRYPTPPGMPVGAPLCPATATAPCPPPNIVYQSAPNGALFPRYSQFWKSDDQGRSFRKSRQFPIYGIPVAAAGGGGGDSHQAIGQVTKNVYFVDLTLAPGVTMNVSEDLGETWRSDPFGEGLSFLDDRQWVEADELAAGGGWIYVSTINLINGITPALIVTRNTTGWPNGAQVAHSPCNPTTFAAGGVGTPAAPVGGETPCPDPADPFLWVAGPVVADNEGTATRPPSHAVYIPFIRRIASDPLGLGIFGIDKWQLWVAKSVNEGETWTRHLVAERPAGNNPTNIFPQLTIDRGGNLYYTWSETQGGPTTSTRARRGDTENDPEEIVPDREQDVHYAFSTNGGLVWSPPINVTPEENNTAVFPWMVAGDPGQVDLVYYQANTGINSNVAFADANEQPCEEGTEGCHPNLSVWNVYFAQSQNALNTGPNFNTVQVTTQPHHIGTVSTGGLLGEVDRDLLDFFTVDVDSLGAAHIAYSDDNRRRNTDTQDYMTRQIAGNSVFKNTTINLQNEWGIRDHAVVDRAGDVYDTMSSPKGSCPGMDILHTAAKRSDSLVTVSMTLNGPPTQAAADACGEIATTGGIWGVEFWAASTGDTGPSNRFYIAYRDDLANGQRVEGGTVDNVNATVTSLEYTRRTFGTLGGNCFAMPPPAGTCTITMTVDVSTMGITPGNALNNLTGLSLYFFGEDGRVPLTRLILGNSEQADATAAFHYLGSGTP